MSKLAAAIAATLIIVTSGCGFYTTPSTNSPAPQADASAITKDEIPLAKLTGLLKEDELEHSTLCGDYFMFEDHGHGVRLTCLTQPSGNAMSLLNLLADKYNVIVDNTKTTPTARMEPNQQLVTVRISNADLEKAPCLKPLVAKTSNSMI